ncbi:MAG TPA: (S)-ureidoglycine aminohydrolase [Candidatus Eremiobacteraceae bacterium]|nr:(S)-ureidoglycine aminohydrolase [Candidatus Eremiobacteraceae bacterium]
MHNLGYSRSSQQRNHLLLTPDTFVRTPLPGLKNALAIVHVGPALGAGFAEYTVEFEAKGELSAGPAQRFISVMEGAVTLESDNKQENIGVYGYAYLPQGLAHRIVAKEKSRVAVIEKKYEAIEKVKPPQLLVGNETDVASHALDGDSDLQVKCLLPDDLSFDFAVNTMVYQPGASLRMVEMHVMEHGLIMLEGSGIYRLGDSWYPVTAGDFIWMGPWCPQWFGALGKVPAKYLIYKNWNRHPLNETAK